MKRLLSVLLVLVLVISMTACGASNAPAATEAPTEKPAETTAAPETTAPPETTEAPTEPPVVYDYQNELVGVNVKEIIDFYIGYVALEVTNLTEYDLYFRETWTDNLISLPAGQAVDIEAAASENNETGDNNTINSLFCKPIYSISGNHVGDISMSATMHFPNEITALEAVDAPVDLEALEKGVEAPLLTMENDGVKMELLSIHEIVPEPAFRQEEAEYVDIELLSLITNKTAYDFICCGSNNFDKILVPAGETAIVTDRTSTWYLLENRPGEPISSGYIISNTNGESVGHIFFDCNMTWDDNGLQVGDITYEEGEDVAISLYVPGLATFSIAYDYDILLYSGEYYDVYLSSVIGNSADGQYYDGTVTLKYLSKAPDTCWLGEPFKVGGDEAAYARLFFDAGRIHMVELPFNSVELGETLTLTAETFQGWDRDSGEIYFNNEIELTVTIGEEPNASVSVN